MISWLECMTTHLEPKSRRQIAHCRSEQLPHIQKRLLQVGLYRNLLPTCVLRRQLRREGISCPKTSTSSYLGLMFDVVSYDDYLRHSCSGQLLVSTGPQPPLVLRMSSTFDSLKPRSTRFLQGVKVEAHGLKGPRRCT